MKIQLDYDTKTIILEDNVNLKEFLDKVKWLKDKGVLPDFKEWKVEVQHACYWNYPVTYQPTYPYYQFDTGTPHQYPNEPNWYIGPGTLELNGCKTITPENSSTRTNTYNLVDILQDALN